MEVAFYYLAIATVILGGILAGRRARSTGQALLLGLASNLITVAMLFCTTILLVVVSPGSLDADDMGFRLVVLLLLGSVVGMVAAIGSRKRAARMAGRLF